MSDAKNRARFASAQARWESPPDEPTEPECPKCGGYRNEPQILEWEQVDEDGEKFVERMVCQRAFHDPPDGEDEYERRRDDCCRH